MTNEELFLEGDALYESGDFPSAFERFERAARNGDAASMLRVAAMYTSGEYVECNYDAAIEWELRAAEAGDLSAMHNLGISYRMKGDIKSSKHWFEKSIQMGCTDTALELAKLYMVSEKEDANVKRYLKMVISSPICCESVIEEAKKLLSEY